MTVDDVIGVLRKAVEAHGSASGWANANGMGAQYVSDVLAGRRAPGPKVLAALGIRKAVSYEWIKGRRR